MGGFSKCALHQEMSMSLWKLQEMSMNVKCLQMLIEFEHLISSCWHCFGILWTFYERVLLQKLAPRGFPMLPVPALLLHCGYCMISHLKLELVCIHQRDSLLHIYYKTKYTFLLFSYVLSGI